MRDGRSITKGQALGFLVRKVGNSVRQAVPMGDLNYVIGLASGETSRWAKFSLETSREYSTYDTLKIETFEGKKLITSYVLKLTDKEYEPASPAARSNPNLEQGGYYWAYDGHFYNWTPDTQAIGTKVNEILKFHGVLR